MDVNYDKDVWEKKRQAVGGLLSYGIWGAGTDLVEYLGQVDNLLTEMENDINTLDVDNALCFSFESNKNAYTELRSDYDILYKYTGEVNTVVERAIDDPFYKKMDAFVEGMEKANIENYKTSAALGFGEWDNFNGSYSGQVLDDVTINDIYNDNNPFADQMYEAYRIYAIAHNESKQYACTADELLSREAFQKGMLNMYGFDYRSINDGAEESELIRDIVATIVITGVSVAAGIVFTPAAGFAVFAGLGAAYSSLDVGSAITGQDISGRNLEDGERLSRLFFAVAGVVPIGRAGGLAEDGISLAGRLGDDVAKGATTIDVAEFGKYLYRMPPGERVAEVKRVAEETAKANGLVKANSSISKKNPGRTIYQNGKGDRYYSVDTQHGTFEMTDKNGRHLGELDINLLEKSGPDLSGKHDLRIK
ncbi:hypothetical protein HB884_08760 [Listeria booriae]|uniref:hypothetical protein n=1 Tax=Listeria booriae TaxID=1552123 RepID=UPI001623663A|nr:hypothetical protein [Listeria booriae]MBC1524293.1 hypothetical protein [Listeria booriae]